MKAQYLISIVSMMRLELHLAGIPECFFRRPNDLINDAMEIGYNGIQAIPIRGLTGHESGIMLFEGAWNPVDSLWQAVRHQPGASGMPSKIQDWVVSPNLNRCNAIHGMLVRRGIGEIHHNFLTDGGRLVEVSPRLSSTPATIAELCADTGNRLVLDTSHLREQPSLLGSNEQEWRDAIDVLAPYVDVIHVNPGDDAGEMKWFLRASSASITARLFLHLLDRLKSKELTIVAEPRPILRGDGGIIQAKKMLAKMKSLVGNS